MIHVLVPSALAAARQTISPPLRKILWRSLGLTILLLGTIWYLLTRGLGYLLAAHPLSHDYPALDTILVVLAGTGLVVGLLYILPVVSAFVAGWFADDAALVVEATDFPADRPGRPLPIARAVAYALRFTGLALLVNLVALALILVPGVNVVAFFGANAYLLGREYFDLAAMRFHSPAEAVALRRAFFGTVLGAGAVMAALMLVPILNLATPIFGIALMVHVQKRVAARAGRP